MDAKTATVTATTSANIATEPSPLEISGWVLFAVAAVIFIVGVSLLFSNGSHSEGGAKMTNNAVRSSSREAFTALQRALETSA